MAERNWQSCHLFMCTQSREENILLKWLDCMKNICDICNGSGQVTYFRGESRFHLSWEDCPACNGSGVQFSPDKDSDNKEATEGELADEIDLEKS